MQKDQVIIRGRTLSGGKPWIIVPIAESGRHDIVRLGGEIARVKADMCEWRADCFSDVLDRQAVGETLGDLRRVLGDIPLLFTFRTSGEGGSRECSLQEYEDLCQLAAASGLADAVDVEIMAGDDLVLRLITNIHAQGLPVIASNHDFQATPAREEILARFLKMQEMGADVLKMAVMPQSPADVLALMSSVSEMVEIHARKPVVAMSMSGLGAISRIACESYGSAMTFGSLGKRSAPGQIPVAELRQAIDILHDSMQL